MKKLSLFALALVGAMSFQTAAHAAPLNASSNVTLTATLGESLTLLLGSSAVTFNLTNGVAATGNTPVTMTTSWVLAPSRTSVALYGYFSSSTSALSDGLPTPDLIPSSAVAGQVPTGTPTVFTPFSQTNAGFGGASASLALFNQPISASSANFVGTRTDKLNLQITAPAALPAGTYTGTLTIQAQAN